MVIAIHELEKIIKQSFPGADIEVNDLAGDNENPLLLVANYTSQLDYKDLKDEILFSHLSLDL